MRTRLKSALPLAALVAALGGWSTSSTAQIAPQSSVPLATLDKQTSRRELIPPGELRESSALNVYDLVARNRPAWLRTRGQTSLLLENRVLVYWDGTPFGGLETLRQINTDAIRSVRFLDGVKATNRLGTGHGNGVIWIESK